MVEGLPPFIYQIINLKKKNFTIWGDFADSMKLKKSKNEEKRPKNEKWKKTSGKGIFSQKVNKFNYSQIYSK